MRAATSSRTRSREVSSRRRTSGSISECSWTKRGSSFASAALTEGRRDRKPKSPNPARAPEAAVNFMKERRCIRPPVLSSFRRRTGEAEAQVDFVRDLLFAFAGIDAVFTALHNKVRADNKQVAIFTLALFHFAG